VTVFGHNGEDVSFRAKKEVIVSSGVFESPKLLMLSGIGPEKELSAHGIKTIVKSEHVGQNLLDHPILAHVFGLKDGLGLEDHLLRAGPQHDGAVAAYRKNKSGLLSSGLLELVGSLVLTSTWQRARDMLPTRRPMEMLFHLALEDNLISRSTSWYVCSFVLIFMKLVFL
jgi:choline dehydrogenase-like flavoprotein